MSTDQFNKNFFSSYHKTPTNSKLLQNWIELSSSAVEHNISQFKEWLGKETQIAAVIKSNAYGHGLIEMAHLYERSNSIAALCVVNLSEAICVRQQNIKKTILVISYLDLEYDLIIQYDIQVVIYDLNIAQQLNEIGKKHKKNISVHIKFDTGMSRLGVTPSELYSFVKELKDLKWLSIVGIFSHLAEGYNSNRTHQQESAFQFIQSLKDDNILPQDFVTHISNSHASMITEHNNYDFARIGIGLYGYLQKHMPKIQDKLLPVLSLKTKILQIKSVLQGDLIGYDNTFQAPTDMTIAILAIGYNEGIDAQLSNCGQVIVCGKLAPIVGRICMNLTIIDISQVSNCTTGQTVTVLGKEGSLSISMYDWSKLSNISVYNHLTKLSTTVPKIIVA